MIATLLAAGSALANAETIEWIGGTGEYESSVNWNTGSVPKMEDTVFIKGEGSLVTQNTRQDWWGMDITITDGATLVCSDSVSKWQVGEVTVSNGGKLVIQDAGDDMLVNNANTGRLILNCLSEEGIYISDHVKVVNGSSKGATINFGLEGSMYVNEIWNDDWVVNVSLQLDDGSNLSGVQSYAIVTREFFTLDHNTGHGVKNLVVDDASVNDKSENLMTSVDSLADLTLDADGMGKYFLSRNSNNGSWSVSFVQAIPEPSTFGLLAGLGALALVGTRRRRR